MTAARKAKPAADRWWRGLSDCEVTARVTAAVSRLFAPPEWATFHEVVFPGVPMTELATLGLPVASRAFERRADVLAVHCWQVGCKGPHLEAIEVKASAADLRREIADPSKRLAVARHCARTWLAMPDGLVPIDEIPAAWGVILIGPDGEARRTRKPVEDNAEPRALSHAIVASLARRMAAALTPAGALDAVGQQERGQAWRAFWRYAGRDLTFAEVVELAQAAFQGSVRGAYWREVEQRAGQLGQIVEWLREATGLRGPITREQVQDWAGEKVATARRAAERAEKETQQREHTERWYAERWETLRELVKGTEFEVPVCNIMANGRAAHDAPPPDWAGIAARWTRAEAMLRREAPGLARRLFDAADGRAEG